MKYFNAFGYRTIGSTTLAGAKSATMPDSPVYELPEECDLVRKHPPESDQEAYERNERIGLAAWAEVERLRRIVSRPLGKPVPVEDEAVRMRRVIEAMRPIVEAAQEWNAVYQTKEAPRERGLRLALSGALGANRERLGLAMSAWENSQTLSEDERNQLTAEEWRALEQLRGQTRRMHGIDRVKGPFAGTRPHIDGDLASMVSALDKLFAANAGRVP